jgi:hypothetical protein
MLKPALLAAAMFSVALIGEYPQATRAVGATFTQAPAGAGRADFKVETPSREARHIADWVVHSRDHEDLPFIVVDKLDARAYVFDSSGALVDASPVLLGTGVGDYFEPGVIDMKMSETRPSQRITPAGRFRAEEWQKPNGEWILWLDYRSLIALHKLRPSQLTLKQRRGERLASGKAEDARASFGCVNVPPAFYDRAITPHFNAKGGIVYVLPDSTPLRAFFDSYDVPVSGAHPGRQAG